MNIYKKKKFINQFKIDYSNFKILKCPNDKNPILCNYNEKDSLFKAYFNKNDCDSCRYNKKCIKKVFNDIYYEVSLTKYEPEKAICNNQESSNLKDPLLEQKLKLAVEMEIGDISNAKKKKGKKYGKNFLCYDGEYLEANSLFGTSWYCHGYGKGYYENGNLEYEGIYVYGHPHGYGKYYYRNGQLKWEGRFEAIESFGNASLEAFMTSEGYSDTRGRIKYGKKYNEDGMLEYEGEFKLGIPDGNGKLFDNTGKVIFVGTFKDGEPIEHNKFKKATQSELEFSFNVSHKSKNKNSDFIIDEDGLKYIGESTEVIIPNSINGKIIDKISLDGFANKHVKKVVLPNTIKVIGRGAFANCSELSEIIIPNSVSNIEAWAFGTCSSLRKIELSDNIIEIGSHAFDECYNLQELRLPKEINYIGAYAFCETGLKKVVLPNGIKYLGNSLFYKCHNLKEVVLQDGLEVIGNYTFANCTNLKKINLPDSIKQITYAAFEGCTSLTNIRIPENLEEMDYTTFNNCICLHNIETDNINKKIRKFDIQNELAKAYGISDKISTNKVNYDTIYNMLQCCTSKKIKAIPINKVETNSPKNYVDILNEGIALKRTGKYEEAMDKYIEAIKMGCKEPIAYYNLGKILYILRNFEASARSYQISFELGIHPYNVLIHLGHALLDHNLNEDKYQKVISFYERGINPYSISKHANNIAKFSKILEEQPTKELLEEYESKCIKAAKKYLDIE